MITYKIQDLQIFPVQKIKLHRLMLKSAKVQPFDNETALLSNLKIYSSDQLHVVVSKLAIIMEVPMHTLSCIFVQQDNQQTPYNYSLNRLKFDNQSILDITTQYSKQANIKEIGPIPFFINDIEYIERFKDDETQLNPEISIRPYSIGDLFEIDKTINIYILMFHEVEAELRKQHMIIKSPDYMLYFKYLFLYKYFPCSQQSDLMIDTQFQLKFNEVQEQLLNEEGQKLFDSLELSYLIESISIKYQLQQLTVDLVLIFDSIKMNDHPNVNFIQYLYIKEDVQFYAQKAHSAQLYPHYQFYQDLLVFDMKSGLKCKINTSGLIQGEFEISPDQSDFEKRYHDKEGDRIFKQKAYVNAIFNEFLQLLRSVTSDFQQYSQQSSDDVEMSTDTQGKLQTDRSKSNRLDIQRYQSKQQRNGQNSSESGTILRQKNEAQYFMISKFQVRGVYISEDLLRQVVHQNKQILGLKGTNERQIVTQIFLNNDSIIHFLEQTDLTSVFELRSACTPLAKLIIPAFLLYILQNKQAQQAIQEQREQSGNLRLLTTDPYLYKQLKPNEYYGRLCKKNQQPIPVDQDDVEDEYQTTYKYHNFTTNKPQLYKCQKGTPYMGFITGKHQRDYCLPCCYPVRQDKSAKKSEVTKTCFVDHKYSKDSQKQSNMNTYIFTNPAKLQVNRNTILHSDIQKFISNQTDSHMAWFVFSLKLPEYTANHSERIHSLIDSCCYLLNVKKVQFIDFIQQEMRATQYSQTQFVYLVNKNDQLLNTSHFEFVISQVVETQFKCNLILIGDIQNNHKYSQIGQKGQETESEVMCFGVDQELSVLVQKRKHIYNPIILGQCDINRKINNTDHISSKYLKIPAIYLNKLKQKFEHQRDQRPHSLVRIVQKLKQSSELHGLKFEQQIINQQGFVYFIELSFKFRKNQLVRYLLPTHPSLPIDGKGDQEQMKIGTKFQSIEGYNSDYLGLNYIIDNIYKCSPQSRIVDGTGQLRGLLFNNLFFYSETNPAFLNLPVHPNIGFNPLLLNQSIIENRFEGLGSQAINTSLRFIYFSNVFRLMKMQYIYFLNNSNKPLTDWSELFSYCSMPEFLTRIEKLSKQKRRFGVQELVKLKACIVADEQQFFCDNQKLLLPVEFKPYIDLLKKDVSITKNIRISQLYQIMLQEFVFQDREGDHLQQGQID